MDNQLTIDWSRALPEELATRVRDARNSGLSDCEGAVLDLLMTRLGKGNALSISDMQAAWTRAGSHVWNERTVKDAAKSLLEAHEIPVGSSRSALCPGFYLCLTPADAEATIRPYRNEIYSLFRRIKCLAPNSSFVRRLNGQLQLNEGDEAA